MPSFVAMSPMTSNSRPCFESRPGTGCAAILFPTSEQWTALRWHVDIYSSDLLAEVRSESATTCFGNMDDSAERRVAALQHARQSLQTEHEAESIRSLAFAFGAAHPKEAGLRAIRAVLYRLEQPEKYVRDQDAWQKHGASQRAFGTWKRVIMSTLGEVMADELSPQDANDAEMLAALECRETRVAALELDGSNGRATESEEANGTCTVRSDVTRQYDPCTFFVGARSEPSTSGAVAEAAEAAGVSVAEAVEKLVLSAADRHAAAIAVVDDVERSVALREGEAAAAAAAAEAAEKAAATARDLVSEAKARLVAAQEAEKMAAREAAREAEEMAAREAATRELEARERVAREAREAEETAARVASSSRSTSSRLQLAHTSGPTPWDHLLDNDPAHGDKLDEFIALSRARCSKTDGVVASEVMDAFDRLPRNLQEAVRLVLAEKAPEQAAHEKRMQTSRDAAKAASADCVVCLEPLGSTLNRKSLNCGHVIHQACFQQLRNSSLQITCPVCRAWESGSTVDESSTVYSVHSSTVSQITTHWTSSHQALLVSMLGWVFQAHAVAEHGTDKSEKEEMAFVQKVLDADWTDERIRREAKRVEQALVPYRAASMNPGPQGVVFDNGPFAGTLIQATIGMLIEMGTMPGGYITPFVARWFETAGVKVPEMSYLDRSIYPFDAIITGLKARPELNGRHATVLRFVDHGQFAGRLAARVDGKMIALNTKNVVVLDCKEI